MVTDRDIVTRWIVDPSGAVEGARTASSAVDKGAKDMKRSLDTTRGSLRGFEKGLAVASVSSGAMATSLSGAAREIILTGTAVGFLGGAITAGGLAIGALGRAMFAESKESIRFRQRLEGTASSARKEADALMNQVLDMDRALKQAKGVDTFSEDVSALERRIELAADALKRFTKEREYAEAVANKRGGDPIFTLIERMQAPNLGQARRNEATARATLQDLQTQLEGMNQKRSTGNDLLAQTLKMEAEHKNRIANATTETKRFAAEMQNLADRIRLQNPAAPGGVIDNYIREITRARQTTIRNQMMEQAKGLERQNALLSESAGVRREILAITQEEVAAEERLFALAGNITGEQRKRLQVAIDENARLKRRAVEEAPMVALAQQGGQMLEQSLGNALIAGVNNNREGFLQAIDGLAQGMQRILSDALLEALQVRQTATDLFRNILGVAGGIGGAATDGTSAEQFAPGGSVDYGAGF